MTNNDWDSYFIEGTKKMFCRKTIPVKKFIETFTVYNSDENSVNQESFFTNYKGENNIDGKGSNIISNETNNQNDTNINNSLLVWALISDSFLLFNLSIT